jgi:hypothetical protein
MFSYEFTRDDGSKAMARFRFRAGSPATYSPIYGADGGDAPEADIREIETLDGDTIPMDQITQAEWDRLDEEICSQPWDDDYYD